MEIFFNTDISFKWQETDIPLIKKNYEMLKLFNQSINLELLYLIDMSSFKNFLSLEFIDLITNEPNSNYGTELYEIVLNFFTELINFFNNYYLKKDFSMLDRIDAEDIESVTPIIKYKIYNKNYNEEKLKKKYSSKRFDVCEFGRKCVDNFIPGATWRWVGSDHRAHLYSIQIFKILIEYGAMNVSQFEDMIQILFLKIQNLLNLETNIHESDDGDDDDIKFWIEDMKKIRELYAEILIHYIYIRQDNEVVGKLKKINPEIDITKQEDEVGFHDSILFDNDFGKKMLSFVLGYILHRNQVYFKFFLN